MVILDTNMILRYLLNDDTEMADKTEHYLNAGDVFVTIEVAAEVVYVLKGVYSMERDQIVSTMKGFLALVECRDMDVLKCALEAYAEHNLDFVDCILFGYHAVKGVEIATFDKKLLKLLSQEK